MDWETVAKSTVRHTLVYTTCTKTSVTAGRGTNFGRALLVFVGLPFPLSVGGAFTLVVTVDLLCELPKTHEVANQSRKQTNFNSWVVF